LLLNTKEQEERLCEEERYKEMDLLRSEGIWGGTHDFYIIIGMTVLISSKNTKSNVISIRGVSQTKETAGA